MKLILGVLVGLVLGSGLTVAAGQWDNGWQYGADERDYQRRQAEALERMLWEQRNAAQQYQRMNPC